MFYFLMLFLAPMVLAEETTYASAGCTIISTDAHQELQCKNLNLQGRLYLTDVPIDIGKLNLAQNNLTSLDPRTITPLIRAIRGTVDLSDNPYFFLFFFPDLSDAFWSIFLFFFFFYFFVFFFFVILCAISFIVSILSMRTAKNICTLYRNDVVS